MLFRYIRHHAPPFAVAIILLGAVLPFKNAWALTLEEAREKCRESIGRPIVQACMRSHGYGGGGGGGRGMGGGGGGGDKDAQREVCRAKAYTQVHACVEKAINAAHGRANVPVAVPAERTVPPEVTPLPVGFIAPPRTIADITAILDGEKPDANAIAKLRSAADAAPPAGKSKQDLAWFYYTRGNARSQLGRLDEAIKDANLAIETGRGAVDANLMGRIQLFAGLQYSFAGNPKQALAVFSSQAKSSDAKGARGQLFGAYRQIAFFHIQTGDIAQAEAYLRRSLALMQEARTSGFPGWRDGYARFGQSWEADVEHHRANLFEARGQYREAEASYRLAEQRRRASIKGILDQKYAPPETQMLQSADLLLASQARMKAKQGRLAEAEADMRRALLSRLKDQGKYHPLTPRYAMGVANVLVEQGRYEEAEKLARISIEINRTVGVAEDSQSSAQLLSNLGNILSYQRKSKEATGVYAELDKAIAKWEPQRRQSFELNGSRIYSLYGSGQVEAGVAAAQKLVKQEIARFGEKSASTAIARGSLAVGYARSGKITEAISEFKAAIPVMMATSRESIDDDTNVVAASSQRLQNIAESYIALLAKHPNATGGDVALETFSIADAIRGQSVQNAVAASSARMSAKDAVLAELIRKEQDLAKQSNGELGTLNNVLALPPSERDEQTVRALRAAIERTRSERAKARDEITRRFPAYAELVDPKPATVDGVRNSLRPGEALLSFYFGRNSSFVWAVPKEGAVAFASLPVTVGDMETKVSILREALQIQPATLAETPPFNVALAHELYSLLLKPIEAAWKPAQSLIVVTNGALGLLPLSLLPTEPTEVNPDELPLFAGYRRVPWLGRTHAVTLVPSSAALRALRQLPAGSDKRELFIGFGDPFFSAEQALAEAKPEKNVEVADISTRAPRRRAVVKTRGIDTAQLERLPRLPDTAEELNSIAGALRLEPSKVLHLGKNANEQTVKTTDLSRYRIVAFSTHGLMAGDLDGLTQPALALSAPDVAGVEGDGLLTMEEILPLKLDADWVLLSACNTAAGIGAGAEAASGLGRAFFYAGSRSLLVTNWAVDSASARDLVTDIFRRQATNPASSRGEVLRQSMMALVDGPGYVQDGKTLYTYAHPTFWAPYSLLGDGGSSTPARPSP